MRTTPAGAAPRPDPGRDGPARSARPRSDEPATNGAMPARRAASRRGAQGCRAPHRPPRRPPRHGEPDSRRARGGVDRRRGGSSSALRWSTSRDHPAPPPGRASTTVPPRGARRWWRTPRPARCPPAAVTRCLSESTADRVLDVREGERGDRGLPAAPWRAGAAHVGQPRPGVGGDVGAPPSAATGRRRAAAHPSAAMARLVAPVPAPRSTTRRPSSGSAAPATIARRGPRRRGRPSRPTPVAAIPSAGGPQSHASPRWARSSHQSSSVPGAAERLLPAEPHEAARAAPASSCASHQPAGGDAVGLERGPVGLDRRPPCCGAGGRS